MSTIRPQDAKPDEVYEGTAYWERWTMRRAFPEVEHCWDATNVRMGRSGVYGLRFTDGDVTNLVRLVPAERRYGDVVVGGIPAAHELAEALRERDELRRHLSVAADRVAAEQTRAQDAERERDEAVGRAEKSERAYDAALAGRDEALAEVESAERERDEWKRHHDRVDGQWAKAEREVTMLRTEAAGSSLAMVSDGTNDTNDAPSVSRVEVEEAMEEFRVGLELPQDFVRPTTRVSALADAVCRLFGIDPDPVEELAEELWRVAERPVAGWATEAPVRREKMRRIAAHVLGQEAKR